MKRYLLLIFLVGLIAGTGNKVWACVPPSGIAGATFQVCMQSTITLTDATPGGAWTSTGAAATIAATGSTCVVTGVAAGTATITYSTGGPCFVVAIVTVNPLPETPGGTLTVCQGATTILTDATTGGTWSSSSGVAVVGSSSGIVTASVTVATTPVSATITYTATNGCTSNVPVTINPLPADIGGASAVCPGLTISLSDATTGGTWSSSNTDVATSGTTTGAVGGVTAGTATITYRITATTCAVSATVTVNAATAAILGIMNICSGATTHLTDATAGGTWLSSAIAVASVNATGHVTGGITPGTATITYTGGCGPVTTIVTVNSLPVITGILRICAGQSTTLSASPSGTWSGGSAAVATVVPATGVVTGAAVSGVSTVDIIANSVAGCSATATVTVNPAPAITGILHVCSGMSTDLNVTPSATWSSANATIASVNLSTGMVTGGAVSAPATVNITATSTAGCTSLASVTVNQLPVITGSVPVCGGQSFTLTASPSGTWSSSNPAVASVIAATGSVTGGGVSAQTTTTITATSAAGCSSATTVSVNPAPAITGLLRICAGLTTNLSASPSGAWSSSNVGAASVSSAGVVTGGNVSAATTVSITSTAGTGCAAIATVTVNPLPVITGTLNVCAGQTTDLNASPSATWSSSNVAVASISTNTGLTTGGAVTTTSTATITAMSAAGCVSTSTVSVNPLPIVTVSLPSQSVCNNASTALIHFSGSATSYNWVNNLMSIGLAGSGATDISGFNAINVSAANVVATITVTPVANGCSGVPGTATITVKPTPNMATPSGQSLCNGAMTTAIDFTSTVSIATYTWVNSNPSIGLANSGTSNIAPFTAANITSDPVTAIFSVTPSAASCAGATRSFTLTVNPTPGVTIAPASQQVCNNTSSIAELFTSATAGTTFSWTNTNTSVGLAASGSGTTITPFTATNATSAPVTATVTVMPLANGCSGTAQSLALTINPTPSVTAVANQVLCSKSATNAVTFAGPVTGTTYSWTNANSSIGLATSGTGNISSFTATNSSAAPISDTIRITPSANSCTGHVVSFALVINPLPAAPVISIAPPSSLCMNTMSQNFGAAVPASAGEAYTWSASSGTVIWAQEKTSHQNALVNFMAAGSAIVTLTDSNTTTHCKSFASSTITVGSSASQAQDTIVSFESNLICLENGMQYQWGYDDTTTLLPDTLTGEKNQNLSLPSPDMKRAYWVITTDPSQQCFQKSYWGTPSHNRNTPNSNGNPVATKVYPNPANNYLDVEFDNVNNDTWVKIMDITGKQVLSLPLQVLKTRIDISALQPSVYFMEYYSNGVKMADSRFIKE